MNCYMRHKVLDGNMDNYVCCQGYYDMACFKAGSVGDQGNACCLACEGCCCVSCAVSSTRMYVMDKYMLSSDPCDRRIIRFNNFMQLLSCICDILACIDPSFQDCAEIIRFIAEIVFLCTAGCMYAQVNVELKERKDQPAINQDGHVPKPPKSQEMTQRPQNATVVQSEPQRTFQVTIPDGVYPGTQLQVVAPTGQTMMFAVPEGAQPGHQVLVPY